MPQTILNGTSVRNIDDLEARISFSTVKQPKVKIELSGAEIAALCLLYIDLRINGNTRTPYFGVHGGADLDINDAWAKINLSIDSFNRNQPNPLPDDRFSRYFYDILHHLENSFGLRLNPLNVIYSRTEEVGGLAGIGYARASREGNVGMIFGTSGPGETNQLTAIGEAWADSTPLMAIWGQVATTSRGRAFQEGFGLEMARPSAKYVVSVKHAEDVAEEIFKSHYIARTGRPGAVVVELPKDVAQAQVEFDLSSLDELFSREYVIPIKDEIKLRTTALQANYSRNLERAVEALSNTDSGIILIGGALVNSGRIATANVFELAKKTGFPVASTLMGIGTYPINDEQFLGMVGMHGLYWASMALYEAGAVLALARLDDRVVGNVNDFTRNEKSIIQVDIDPEELGRRMEVIPVLGEVGAVLEHLVQNIKTTKNQQQWWDRIHSWKKEHPMYYDQTRDDVILPQYLIQSAMDVIPHGSVISTGVGASQMWAAQYAKNLLLYRWLSSGGFGTMGFGAPASLGAFFAVKHLIDTENPQSSPQIWDIDGDGGFEMTLQALGVAREYNIPIRIVIPIDGYRIVRQWQIKMYGGRTNGSDRFAPDFAKLAEAYGVEGITVTKKPEVKIALDYMRNHRGPILGAFKVDEKEMLLPWILSGHSPYSREGNILTQIGR